MGILTFWSYLITSHSALTASFQLSGLAQSPKTVASKVIPLLRRRAIIPSLSLKLGEAVYGLQANVYSGSVFQSFSLEQSPVTIASIRIPFSRKLVIAPATSESGYGEASVTKKMVPPCLT